MSELFPPFVGGSAVLFEGIYSRLREETTVVLTDTQRSPGPDGVQDGLWVEHRLLASDDWGLMKPRALRHHFRVSRHIRELARRRHTLVHCGRTLPEGLAALLGRIRGGSPYLCWAHGEDITMQTSTSRELRLLTRWIVRFAAGIIANSHYTAGLLVALGVPADKIHVIYPGVDSQRFRPEVDGYELRRRLANDGGPLLLSIGRLERRKGFDLTIRAVARLRDSVPGLRYVLVGDGPDRGYLEAMIRDLGVDKQVTLMGKVPAADLPHYYAACDLFVHPNRIEGVDVEGFGIVFLEAAACGKAVIGGTSGGVPEAVLDGETGVLVSGTDEQELASTMTRLIERPELRSKMGSYGRQRVVTEFTWQRAAAEVAAVQQALRPS